MENFTVAKSTALIIAGVIILIVFISLRTASTFTVKTCDDFKTQVEAQKHYTVLLDRDRDGIACETLP